MKAVSDRENGVLALGLIASFSQVGSVVSKDFLESITKKSLSDIIKELLRAQHILEMFIGPAQKQFLLYTHPELARLLRNACTPVLQDMFSTDDAAAATHSLRIRVAGTTYYLMVSDSVAAD